MRWTRFYTQPNRDVLSDIRFRSVVAENQQTYMVPFHWGAAAADLLQEKIFHPHVLPAVLRRVEEPGVPAWLWRSEADTEALDGVSAEWRYHIEKDTREVLHRIAGALTYQGWKDRLFTAEEDAKAFYDELRYILLHQIATLELHHWQHLGLNWAYGAADTQAAPHPRTVFLPENASHVLRRLRILGETLALDNAEHKTNVVLPVENDESLDFINWKKSADIRQTSEAIGQRVLEAAARRIMDACDRDAPDGFNPHENTALAAAISDARRAGLPEAGIRMAVSYARQGYEDISFPLPLAETTAEEFLETTLSLSDDFIESALTDHGFSRRPAQKLWDALAESIWSSGEPALSFRDSAPPGDATAPAAMINLLGVAQTKEIVDTAALRHVTRVMVTALDILSPKSSDIRPLNLGVANMAALLMSKGLAYDSDGGRATAALVTAFVSGAAYHVSAEMAEASAPFAAWTEVSKSFLQNIKNKIAIISGTALLPKGAMRRPLQLRPALCPDVLLCDAVREIWEAAYQTGKETGFRHAHLTGIDGDRSWPVLLGAQTPGIVPVASPMHGKSINPLIPAALKSLGYTPQESDDIFFYMTGHGTLLDAPHINHQTLRAKGFPQSAIDAVESALTTALHIRYAFNKWTLGEDVCVHVFGFAPEDMDDDAFDMLPALGFSEDDIAAANTYCCGTMTLAGAPHLKQAHAAVFNNAITPAAQTKMQAAVEPFLSGLLAHTVRLDYDATVDDVKTLILSSWELGLKTLRLYRDNGSLLHAMAPLFDQTQTEQNTHDFQSLDKLSA